MEHKGCECMYRIFIVEDDRTIAQEVCRLAESWGLEARCACDLRAVTGEAAAFAAIRAELADSAY